MADRQKAHDEDEYVVIFRRYRRVGGKVLDAHDYGYRAWPIRVKRNKAA